jgi:uncharacterized SAM-binding protein YcdF (DUF218 family)
MHFLRKLLAIVVVLFLVAIAATVGTYRAIPSDNTNLTHFDAIIVLGYPGNLDGTPSPEQRERTLEAVREFKSGVAPHIIVSGGAAHNQFAEAHEMAILAIAQGVPPTAIVEEGQARDTIQNIFYSQRIMASNNWTSAEVVSSPSHLPRTSLILSHYRFPWRTRPASWPPEYNFLERAAHFCVEAEYCLKLRTIGFPPSPFLPNSNPPS